MLLNNQHACSCRMHAIELTIAQIVCKSWCCWNNQCAHNCKIEVDSTDWLNAWQFDNDYQELKIEHDSLQEW